MFDFFESATQGADSVPSAEAPGAASDGERRLDAETPPIQTPMDSRAARLKRFEREQLIVDYLNRGVSVSEIAARVGLGEKRMRAVIREILARRMPHPPEEFVAIQVSRLNEALLVAYSAMSGANLKAVDRVVRIVRELDRYHGLAAAGRRLPEPERLGPPVEAAMGFGAALVCGAEFALHGPAKIEPAPEAAEAPAAAERKPDACPPRESGKPAAAAAPLPGRTERRNPGARFVGRDEAGAQPVFGPQAGGRPEIPPQGPEKIESAPGLAGTVTAADAERRLGARRPGESGGLSAAAPLPQHAQGRDLHARFRERDHAATEDGARPTFGPQSDKRPENPPQRVDKAESAPGTAAPAKEANAWVGSASLPRTGPGFRLVRAMPNGVAAC